MNRSTNLVSYKGAVYHWDTVTRTKRGRMALISPIGGGTEIAAYVRELRVLPGPGMRTTYAYAGT